MPWDYPYDFEFQQERQSAAPERPLVSLDEMRGFQKETQSKSQDKEKTFFSGTADGAGESKLAMFVPVKDQRRDEQESKARTTTNLDGSKVWTNERGQVIRVDKGNGETQRYSYDSKGNLTEIDKLHRQGNSGDLFRHQRTIKRPDGKWQSLSASGRPDGDAFKADIRVNLDGSIVHKVPDGSSTVHRTDGVTETTKRDGTVIEKRDGLWATKITYKDGTTRELGESSYKDRDGTVWKREEGKWHEYRNGEQTGETRDGNFEAGDNGTVYERDANGEAKAAHYTDGKSTIIVHGKEIDMAALARQMRR